MESSEASIDSDERHGDVSYDDFSRSFTVRHQEQLVQFGPNELEQQFPSVLRFGKSPTGSEVGGTFTIGLPRPDLSYVLVAEHAFSQSNRTDSQAQGFLVTERRFLIGVPTVRSDLPTSGISTYSVELRSSLAAYGSNAGFQAIGGSIVIDHATGIVDATIDIRQTAWPTGTVPEQGRLNLSGRVAGGANEISGTIAGSTGRGIISGQFVGRLYGPRGVETSFLFKLTRASPENRAHTIPIVGQIAGLRQ